MHRTKHTYHQSLPAASSFFTPVKPLPPEYVQENSQNYDDNCVPSPQLHEQPRASTTSSHQEPPINDLQSYDMPAYEPTDLRHLAVNECTYCLMKYH